MSNTQTPSKSCHKCHQQLSADMRNGDISYLKKRLIYLVGKHATEDNCGTNALKKIKKIIDTLILYETFPDHGSYFDCCYKSDKFTQCKCVGGDDDVVEEGENVEDVEGIYDEEQQQYEQEEIDDDILNRVEKYFNKIRQTLVGEQTYEVRTIYQRLLFNAHKYI